MTMLETTSLAQLSIWTALSFYFLALVPQIILNYRLKSATGFSDLYLWAFFNGYIAEVFYVFFLDLPFAYKVFVPLGALCIMIIVFQRFYYADSHPHTKRLAIIYAINGALMAATIPYMLRDPLLAGHITGWMATSIWTIYQVPQILKIYHERSVKGFSFTFATICGIASILELGVAAILQVPLQTQVNALRGIGYYLIFCLQFILYRS